MKDKSLLEDIKAKIQNNESDFRYHVFVCGGSGCDSMLSREVYDELCSELARRKLEDEVNVVMTGCHGLCSHGPIMTIYPDGLTYARVLPIQVEEIVDEHFIHGRPVSRLLYTNTEFEGGDPQLKLLKDSAFMKLQNRKVLKNNGTVCPKSIDSYIQRDGYFALCKAVKELTPEQVIEIITESGLRGRGGGSFPTGQKWDVAAKEVSDSKYIICNADEGDLGCYMDRAILEGNPHGVLEAMAIAAYAVHADKGYIFIRPDYTVAVENLKEAIKQAREYGLLGEHILESELSFDVELRFGAGAYVSGEETAIISGFDLSRSEPMPKQLYPAVSGLHSNPTVINNVETFAYVPQIVLGSGKIKADTKIFALGGAVQHTGLVEVPVGTTIHRLINDIGGGAKPGRTLKAIVTGGASGSFIPVEKWDLELDYDVFRENGFVLGGGGITVLDDESCIVNMTQNALRFSVKESCGKCSACRLGTAKMYEI
ncbi:MAG: NAD(P)H-dependent oxidoreductase subunit E, partial [Lachnospiraceae bacterium]|nr:NAD(P)H-dependent oxidoreductase subunit E [Lachnospiraceae bacterium]